MSKQIPSYLKLVTETPPPDRRANEDLSALLAVCQAFGPVAGCQLEYVDANAPSQPNLRWSAPVNPGVGATPGLFRLLGLYEGELAGNETDSHDKLENAKRLAGAIGGLWQELLLTRQALWEREAELAVNVPVVEHRHEARQLAARLEAVLRGGAEAIGCHAAAIYLLDDATSELKMRSSWGLPRRRLIQNPRQLSDQLADLEAMLGHAVVLDDPAMFGLWRVPEKCAACVCVPISTPTMPLGTLWIFSQEPREFSDADTNMIEMIAGRLAADLEREMLLAEAGRQKREAISAGDLPAVLAAPIDVAKVEVAEMDAPIIRVKPQGLPSSPPVIDGWQVAAGVTPTDTASGAFFDWFERGDGSLAIVAGCVSGLDMQAALAAAELRAAGRVLGPDGRPANQLIERAGELLWAHSCGDLSAGLMQAYIWPNQPIFESAVGGPLQAFRIFQDDYELIAKPTLPLGSAEGSSILLHKHRSPHHDLIVGYALNETQPKIGNWAAEVNGSLAKALAPMRKSSAERLLETAQEILSQACTKDRGRDRVVLVIKRR